MNSITALMRSLVALGIVSLVFLAGCGAQSVNNQPTAVTVLPASATVQAGSAQQFTATVSPSRANQSVNWSISGAGCAEASCGTIDETGNYTAPATVPNPATIMVTATLVPNPATVVVNATLLVDSTTGATATITITVAPAAFSL